MERCETHEHDVLVIGAGGAGLRAAIEASANGCSTGLVCKSLLGKAHTVMAEGGIAAAMGNVNGADDWKTHFRDTVRGAKFLNNFRMAQLHAQESPDRVRELEEWGAVFDRTPDGRISQRPFGGHTYERLCHVGDRTGLEMIRTLQDKGVHAGIDVYMECTVTRLLMDGERIAGAVAYRRLTGTFVIFRAKAVVICTGGIGRSFKITSNSWECTGDGVALAYLAGAELLDMEFVQFHPTGMVWPPGVRGLLVTEAVRGEGGMLRNARGERFMEKYDPERMELSTRDVVSQAIYTEVKEGRGSEHGGVYLDVSHRGAGYIRRRLPSMYTQFKDLADVDITRQPMEVGPTTHYAMGGILVDADTAASSVPGLYSAGEASGGMNGANRLGGNSLSDLLVFGRRAGMYAAEYAKGLPAFPAVDPSEAEAAVRSAIDPLVHGDGESPYAIHRDLKINMQDNVGMMRTHDDIAKGIETLERLKRRAAAVRVAGGRAFNPAWNLALELRAMLIVSEAVARCALWRTESRGAHARLDHPKTDPEWGKVNSVTVAVGGEMTVRAAARLPMSDDLGKLLSEVT